MDALATAALELPVGAAWFLGLGAPAAAFHGLVGAVSAVSIAVAAPRARHALRAVAAELVWPTGGR